MKTIKFEENKEQDLFYTSLRGQVNEYLRMHRFDGFATPQVWTKAVFYLGLQIGLYLFLLNGDLSLGTSLIVWSALGINGVLIGLNISHDAAHHSLSPNKGLNDCIYRLTFNALGANAHLWQMRHIQSHHLFPNVDDCDADIDDNPIIRLSPHKQRYGFQKWQHLYAPFVYLFYTLVWILIKDFIILSKQRLANLKDIHHPQREIRIFYLAKFIYFFYLLAIPVWCMSLPWGQVLTGFLFMHFAQSYTFIFGLIASHFSMETAFPKVDQEGNLPRSWAKHQVATSLDYHATEAWANFIFGGFNAHVAHHLFPQISHVHYPAISAIIQQQALVFRIPYHQTTFPKAIASHFRYLKKLGRGGV